MRVGIVIGMGADKHNRLAGPLLNRNIGLLLRRLREQECWKKDEATYNWQWFHCAPRRAMVMGTTDAASLQTESSPAHAPVRKSRPRRVPLPCRNRHAVRRRTCANPDTT